MYTCTYIFYIIIHILSYIPWYTISFSQRSDDRFRNYIELHTCDTKYFAHSQYTHHRRRRRVSNIRAGQIIFYWLWYFTMTNYCYDERWVFVFTNHILYLSWLIIMPRVHYIPKGTAVYLLYNYVYRRQPPKNVFQRFLQIYRKAK